MEIHSKRMMRWAPKLMAATFVVIFLVGVIFFVRHFINDGTQKKNIIHEISLIKPPPPPPPKPEEKPPELLKKEEVKLPEPPPDVPPPEPVAQDAPKDDAPPSENLGLDVTGQGNGDAFGLVGNPGGRSIIGGGRDGDTSKRRYTNYASQLQQSIYDALEKNQKLRESNYKLVVSVWVGSYGEIERFELANSSGSPDMDSVIKSALREVSALKQAPPEGMPQPVKLRITSRL